jgi:hypothetical protein
MGSLGEEILRGTVQAVGRDADIEACQESQRCCRSRQRPDGGRGGGHDTRHGTGSAAALEHRMAAVVRPTASFVLVVVRVHGALHCRVLMRRRSRRGGGMHICQLCAAGVAFGLSHARMMRRRAQRNDDRGYALDGNGQEDQPQDDRMDRATHFFSLASIQYPHSRSRSRSRACERRVSRPYGFLPRSQGRRRSRIELDATGNGAALGLLAACPGTVASRKPRAAHG